MNGLGFCEAYGDELRGGLFHHFITFSCFSIFLFFVTSQFMVFIIQWWFLLSIYGWSLTQLTLNMVGYGQCYYIWWVIQPAMPYDAIYGRYPNP